MKILIRTTLSIIALVASNNTLSFDQNAILNANQHGSYIFEQLYLKKKSECDLEMYSKQLLTYYIDQKIEYSQTEAEMLGFFEKKNHLFKDSSYTTDYQLLWNNEYFCNLIHKVINFEKQEQRKGRYTFVHGQPWFLQFYQDLYLFLWQEYFKTSIKQPFVFLRFKDVNAFSDANVQAESKIREHLVKNGSQGYYSSEEQPYLVFLNYALFANTWGSSSARYLIRGDGENRHRMPDFSTKYICNCFNYNTVYQQYKNELKALKKEHAQLNPNGCLLLFSICPTYLDTILYSSYAGRKNILTIPTIGTTTNCKQIIDVLRSSPHLLQNSSSRSNKTIEFSLIITADQALKPSDNMHIHTLCPIEDNIWKEYTNKRDALFTKIAYTIQTENR